MGQEARQMPAIRREAEKVRHAELRKVISPEAREKQVNLW